MTAEEAAKIVSIMMTADGGCGVCVGSLLHYFAESYPQFRDIAQAAWSTRHEGVFDDE